MATSTPRGITEMYTILCLGPGQVASLCLSALVVQALYLKNHVKYLGVHFASLSILLSNFQFWLHECTLDPRSNCFQKNFVSLRSRRANCCSCTCTMHMHLSFSFSILLRPKRSVFSFCLATETIFKRLQNLTRNELNVKLREKIPYALFDIEQVPSHFWWQPFEKVYVVAEC